MVKVTEPYKERGHLLELLVFPYKERERLLKSRQAPGAKEPHSCKRVSRAAGRGEI